MVHEKYQYLPPMSDREYQELKEDIIAHGVLVPIIVDEEGNIIDGHHRAKVCEELGLEWPLVVKAFDSEEEKQAVAIGLNLKRRQLSPEQAEQMRAKMKELVVTLRKQGKSQHEVATLAGIPRGTIARWEAGEPDMKVTDLRVSIPKSLHQEIHDRVSSGESVNNIAGDYKITPERIRQISTLVSARQVIPNPVGEIEALSGQYRSIIIDPPWPMEKIEREVAPNQGVKLDYPVMSLEEIAALPVKSLVHPQGTHLYLWTTHKFLPDALDLVKQWGFNYHALMTWVKPSGFTPFSYMYNTEHVIFASCGWYRPERLGIKLAFEGKVVRHSQKPDVFYDIIREATPEPRLEMFARTPREGFVVWGNEV